MDTERTYNKKVPSAIRETLWGRVPSFLEQALVGFRGRSHFPAIFGLSFGQELANSSRTN